MTESETRKVVVCDEKVGDGTFTRADGSCYADEHQRSGGWYSVVAVDDRSNQRISRREDFKFVALIYCTSNLRIYKLDVHGYIY